MHTTPPILFNHAHLRKRRARAAAHLSQHDFLWREAASRAEESLAFLTHQFPTMLGFGTHAFTAPAGTTRLIHCADTAEQQFPHQVVASEEWLPFADNSVDAVISLLSLQWVNDIPGALAQMHRVLKPDGLLLAILPGGNSLHELRQVMAETEEALHGGITPRVAPFMDVRDGGALLQRAGFALPVADSETVTITYPHLFALCDDLRGSGASNILQQRLQHFTPRRFFMEAARRYAEQFASDEGGIHATAELVTLTGWKPAPTQQKPARRGSGTTSLREALAAKN